MQANRRRIRSRAELDHEHDHHDDHLCVLVAQRDMARVADLARDARFMCHVCGRATAEDEYLCEPVEI